MKVIRAKFRSAPKQNKIFRVDVFKVDNKISKQFLVKEKFFYII